MKRYLILATLAVALISCHNSMKIKTQSYPVARYDSTVTDSYFGRTVADPYRWLEDDNSDETARWVAAENAVTADYLAQIPYRGAIVDRLKELYNYPKYSTPSKVGEYYMFSKNDGLQNQSVIYIQKGEDGEPEVLLDPNTLSSDGTVALGTISISKDDKYMAYSVSTSGSDWVEIRVMDIATRQPLTDVIRWVKFSGAEWGEGGFYYSRYDEPKAGSELSAANSCQRVYYHQLGTEQSADKLIYEDTAHPLRYFSAQVSDDDKYLFINSSEGTSGSEILYKELGSTADFKVLFAGFEYDYYILYSKAGRTLVYTNDHAENYRLAEVDLSAAKPAMKDVIAQTDNLLQGASVAGGSIFATYLSDASNRVYQYDMSGKLVRDIELEGIGTVGGFRGKDADSTLFYAYTSFNTPMVIYKYDIASGVSEVFRKTDVKFNPDDYEVNQVFYPSKDGTQVPMFIVNKKGIIHDGQNPVMLYAYGGFNISLTPSFSPSRIAFMEQGGIYVLANIRGGGEYGESWHKGGMLANKQTVFDDFIGAAEYLVASKYTSPSKIAISGGSNGGLLVGACLVQRPDLFAVAFPMVGVLDMLRYHKFTIGWGWAVEYGTSDNQEQFDYLIKYSPLHNIKQGECYPATMVMTADHDDRVVPAHSFKFGATLQAAQGCDKPILVRVESNAGHGAGKPMSKQIEEQADMWSFLLWNTGTQELKK